MTGQGEIFDESGVLRPECAASVAPADKWIVMLQVTDARIALAELTERAARFFGTKIGSMTAKRYGPDPVSVEYARIVVAPEIGTGETRGMFVRAATEEDWALASTLERERSATNMGVLARRCRFVAEIERTSNMDATALLLAAIVASTHLGPIIDVTERDIFGVKTARAKLTRAQAVS